MIIFGCPNQLFPRRPITFIFIGGSFRFLLVPVGGDLLLLFSSWVPQVLNTNEFGNLFSWSSSIDFGGSAYNSSVKYPSFNQLGKLLMMNVWFTSFTRRAASFYLCMNAFRVSSFSCLVFTSSTGVISCLRLAAYCLLKRVVTVAKQSTVFGGRVWYHSSASLLKDREKTLHLTGSLSV